ncbi:MAG: site-specific integrase [Hyphomonadaceae bacterium]|nr:site-specific integrase [Hyphomonadaceae bacterium]
MTLHQPNAPLSAQQNGPHQPIRPAAPSRQKTATKIAQKALSAMPNPVRETWVWDTDVKGFFVRAYPSGLKSFALKYRVDGRQKVYTIGKYGSPWTVEQARQRAVELLYEAQHGVDPQAQKAKQRRACTVSELVTAYLHDGPKDKPNKRQRSWDNDRLHLIRHVVPLIGTLKAHAVTGADIARLQADVADGKTSTTIKTKKRGVARVRGGKRAAAVCVVCVQAMYNWAIKRKLATDNPARGVVRFETEIKERYLSREEIAALLRALERNSDEGQLSRDLASAFRLLLMTGARKSEISDLRWEEIDLERGLITLSALRSKTGRKRIVLPSAAIDELKRLRPQKTGYVFPARRGYGPTRSLQDAWEMIRIDAGIEDVRIHDLRHTFASLAAAEGQSLYLIGKALGHAQSRTTERYAHLAHEPLRAVSDAVTRRFIIQD